MQEPTDVLPRVTLRPEHFRKYEVLLAQATEGSYEIDPRTLQPPLKPMKAASFIHGMQEARRAFSLYGGLPEYKSTLIPYHKNLSMIKFYETREGKVQVRNTYIDSLNQQRGNVIRPLKTQPVVNAVDAELERITIKGETINCNWNDEEKRLMILEKIRYELSQDSFWLKNNNVNFIASDLEQAKSIVSELKSAGYTLSFSTNTTVNVQNNVLPSFGAKL